MGDFTTVKIKWESLPEQYRTKANKYYDLDNDGWISEKNKNGQNEIKLMESALGISLDKYAVTTEMDYSNENVFKESIQGPNGRIVSYKYENDGSDTRYVDSVFNASGRLVFAAENNYSLTTRNGYGKNNLYEEVPLTLPTGYYKLVRKTHTQYNAFAGRLYYYGGEEYAAGVRTPEQLKLTKWYGKPKSDKYYLNGEEVKSAKDIGGETYQVTKKDGTVMYISQSGVMLNPADVAKNPPQNKKSKKQEQSLGIE